MFFYLALVSSVFFGSSMNASDGLFDLLVGRAGRYGSKFPVGEVTCIDAEDLPLLHSSLNAPSPTLEVIVPTMKMTTAYLVHLATEFFSTMICYVVQYHLFMLGRLFLIKIVHVMQRAGLFPTFDLMYLYSRLRQTNGLYQILVGCFSISCCFLCMFFMTIKLFAYELIE